MQYTKCFLLCGFLLCAALSFTESADTCKNCMTNNVQCLDDTHYNVCFGSPLEASPEIFSCDEGTVCTASADVCDDERTATPICEGGAGSCATTCAVKGEFYCVSLTQFTTCKDVSTDPTAPDLQVTGRALSCPDDQFCSEGLKANQKICGPQVVLDFLELEPTCTVAGPTTTVSTVSTTTTTLSPQNTINLVCMRSSKTGSYFLEENVEDCKTYIYCEYNESTGHLVAMLMNCKTGQYYNAAQAKCVEASRCPQ